MAKAVGNTQIVVPRYDAGAFNAAAGNGKRTELARNLAEAVSLERQDSGELTPGSRVSWASQVEEEHEATGWSGHPRPPSREGSLNKGAAGSSAADTPHDAAVKKSKKKKKKGKSNANTPTAGASSEKTEQQSLDTSPGTEGTNSMEGSGVLELGVDGNADKKVTTSPLGRVKSGNGSSSVWALKRSDSGNPRFVEEPSPKAGGSPGRGKLPPPASSSWQPVVTKDAAARQAFANDSVDAGWGTPPLSKQNSGGSSSGGWAAAAAVASSQVETDDSGWKVAGPRRIRGESPSAAVAGEKNWELSSPVEMGSNWDSGWEVAGSRRGKKGEEASVKSPRGPPNLGQRGKGGGRGQGLGQNQYGNRGPKPRSPAQSEKGGRGGRGSSGNPLAPSSLGAPRQAQPTQLMGGWGKPLNNSGWEPQPVQTQNNDGSSGASDSSNNILGKLLPPTRAVEVDSKPVNGGPVSTDSWKGGFPAFSGNGSSVFDDYPASLYSDSQCSDDDLDSDSMSVGSFHSSDSYKSHSTQRNNKWFKQFFQELDLLTEGQLQEHDRQWHCPACSGGVGAIDWYRGLQPLLAHAKTVRSKRVKLHKMFADVLEDEIRIRGAATGTHGSGKYGKWRGLGDENVTKDILIVWPPMVVVRNTQLEQDEDDKWIGMGNKELLDLFKKDNPVKARHAYGPQGHRGISILIFAESPTGYYNAQRLDKQFSEANRGRENWDFPGKLLFRPGGDRILYVYMASPEDLDIFNKHSKGKQNLKWERRSLQETVLSPMRRQDDEQKKVSDLQGKVLREMEASKALKKTMSQMSAKLSMREEELRVIRDRAREQHKQQEIEMEDMEAVYKERIEQLKKEIAGKEGALEKVHEDYEQEHLQQCEELEQKASKIPKDTNLSEEQQQQQALMKEEIARHSQLVELCIKNHEEWEKRKVELQKEHHQKMMDFKSRQWKEQIAFEQKLDQERVAIMETFQFPAQMKV